jgi:hypothetical protein
VSTFSRQGYPHFEQSFLGNLLPPLYFWICENLDPIDEGLGCGAGLVDRFK